MGKTRKHQKAQTKKAETKDCLLDMSGDVTLIANFEPKKIYVLGSCLLLVLLVGFHLNANTAHTHLHWHDNTGPLLDKRVLKIIGFSTRGNEQTLRPWFQNLYETQVTTQQSQSQPQPEPPEQKPPDHYDEPCHTEDQRNCSNASSQPLTDQNSLISGDTARDSKFESSNLPDSHATGDVSRDCPAYAEIANRELRPFASEGIGAQEVLMAFEVIDRGKRILMSINSTGTYVHFEPPVIEDGHIRRCIDGFIGSYPFKAIQQALVDEANKIMHEQRSAKTPHRDNNLSANDVGDSESSTAASPTLVWSMNLHASSLLVHDPNRPTILLPVLSYGKAKGDLDILFPRPYFHEFFVQSRDFAEEGYGDWNTKKNISVFRGALTHHLREEIAVFSQDHPDLVDAGLTEFVINPTHANLTLVKPMPLIDQLRAYKYVLYIDGHGSADRFPYLLAADTTAVLKPGHDTHNLQIKLLGLKGRPVLQTEFFSSLLKPGYHYHPFKSDLSDLESAIEFLQGNDQYAHQIAMNGAQFTNTMMNREMVTCYMKQLAVQYFRLQRDPGHEILQYVKDCVPLLQTVKIEFCDTLMLGHDKCRAFR
eukprot:c6507_g1_i1.p1 GENE.c6507_g1_i1~~c6507_g1_i1.p1  ORF type:complete len:593 (-),score=130.43 c6507_g1_i1:377-2155(-)